MSGRRTTKARDGGAAHHDEAIVRSSIVRRGASVKAVLEAPKLRGAGLSADGLDVPARSEHVAPRIVWRTAADPVGEVLSSDEPAVDLAALVEGVAHAAPLGAGVGVVDVVGAKVPAGLRGEVLGAAGIEDVAELVVVRAVGVLHGASAASGVPVAAGTDARASRAVRANIAGSVCGAAHVLRHVGEDRRVSGLPTVTVLGRSAATCRDTQTG